METGKFHVSVSSVSYAAIYLCKRTMQNKTRLDLADYEAVSAHCCVFLLICASALVRLRNGYICVCVCGCGNDGKYKSSVRFHRMAFSFHQENLARLQRAFARKWEFIYMQAEAQVK